MLPELNFKELNDRVFERWIVDTGWKTRARRGESTIVVPRLQRTALKTARDLFEGDVLSAHFFQYLYHSLHESSDLSGLIDEIKMQVSRAWNDVICDVCIPTPTKSNFSLTCFDQGCFLGPHTDAGGTDLYKVTLLLYFGNSKIDPTDGALRFRFRENDIIIAAKPNRAVLFVPNNDTVHWVPEITRAETCRFAFSGWLL